MLLLPINAIAHLKYLILLSPTISIIPPFMKEFFFEMRRRSKFVVSNGFSRFTIN